MGGVHSWHGGFGLVGPAAPDFAEYASIPLISATPCEATSEPADLFKSDLFRNLEKGTSRVEIWS
jgi:hypothetical protein